MRKGAGIRPRPARSPSFLPIIKGDWAVADPGLACVKGNVPVPTTLRSDVVRATLQKCFFSDRKRDNLIK